MGDYFDVGAPFFLFSTLDEVFAERNYLNARR